MTEIRLLELAACCQSPDANAMADNAFKVASRLDIESYRHAPVKRFRIQYGELTESKSGTLYMAFFLYSLARSFEIWDKGEDLNAVTFTIESDQVEQMRMFARKFFGAKICSEALGSGGEKHANLFRLLSGQGPIAIGLEPLRERFILDVRAWIFKVASMTADELSRESGSIVNFPRYKALLNAGTVRAAEPAVDGWHVNSWVKQGILAGMRLGRPIETSVIPDGDLGTFTFVDKSTWPLKRMSLDNKVRIVPGGSSVRDGAYLATGVVMMPPAYVNVGAYVDEETMIDSHALVGSCAQVGKRVHLSAGVQIGGVLEPVGAIPVIIEDEVTVGGNCGIYEGTIVRKRAVIGTGVILNGSTPVYDVVNGTVLRKTDNSPLIIPEGAVVVAGSRPASGEFANGYGLSLYTPIIIKYRDERTDAATALEQALR